MIYFDAVEFSANAKEAANFPILDSTDDIREEIKLKSGISEGDSVLTN